eukprot:365852-Chlamydomonas_euryale.AAC.11
MRSLDCSWLAGWLGTWIDSRHDGNWTKCGAVRCRTGLPHCNAPTGAESNEDPHHADEAGVASARPELPRPPRD